MSLTSLPPVPKLLESLGTSFFRVLFHQSKSVEIDLFQPRYHWLTLDLIRCIFLILRNAVIYLSNLW